MGRERRGDFGDGFGEWGWERVGLSCRNIRNWVLLWNYKGRIGGEF